MSSGRILRRAAVMAHTMATSSPGRNSAHTPWIRWLLYRKFRAEHYWDAALFFPARGHEFSTCGVDAGDTDKLKTCRHGGQHIPCRTGVGRSSFEVQHESSIDATGNLPPRHSLHSWRERRKLHAVSRGLMDDDHPWRRSPCSATASLAKCGDKPLHWHRVSRPHGSAGLARLRAMLDPKGLVIKCR